jgi:hypothetical protein
MHLAKPCRDPVMETGLAQQEPADAVRKNGDAAAKRVGVFVFTPLTD